MPIKRIDISKLKTGMSLANPVYAERDRRRVLLLTNNTLITNELQIKRLMNAGIQTVEIDTDRGIDTFHTLLEQKRWEEIAQLAKSTGTTEAIISRHIDTFINSITTTVSKNITSRNVIREDPINALFKDIIYFIEDHIDLLLALVRLKTASEYTFSHAVNTTILSISLANYIKLSYPDIKRLGLGAMLADLGMTSYPSRMIKRPSGLSKKELVEIKKHPLYTLQFLEKIGISDYLIETLIIQHHERYDGTGYPNGLQGDELHTISKLFSITDVYDAMTSTRPHRIGLPPHMVLAEILKMSGTLFDPQLAKIFIKHIGVFPVGSMVELTSGRFALVAGLNKSEPLKPPVIIFSTRKTYFSDTSNDRYSNISISRGNWELVDLASEGAMYGRIRRGLDHRKFHVNPEYYLKHV